MRGPSPCRSTTSPYIAHSSKQSSDLNKFVGGSFSCSLPQDILAATRLFDPSRSSLLIGNLVARWGSSRDSTHSHPLPCAQSPTQSTCAQCSGRVISQLSPGIMIEVSHPAACLGRRRNRPSTGICCKTLCVRVAEQTLTSEGPERGLETDQNVVGREAAWFLHSPSVLAKRTFSLQPHMIQLKRNEFRG